MGPCSIARSSRLAGFETTRGDFAAFFDDEASSPDLDESVVVAKTPSKRDRRRDVQFLEDGDVLEPVPKKVLEPSLWRRVVAGAWKRPDAMHSKEAGCSARPQACLVYAFVSWAVCPLARGQTSVRSLPLKRVERATMLPMRCVGKGPLI